MLLRWLVVLVTAAVGVSDSCPCMDKCNAADIPVYHSTGGSCYRLMWTSSNWENSKELCRLDGGSLAQPRTTETASYVATTVTKMQQYVWVGARYNTTTSKWAWGDGTIVDSSLWAGSVPSGEASQCGFISQDGKLYAWDCQGAMVFVCEKRAITFTQETITPTLAEALGASAGGSPFKLTLKGIGLASDILATLKESSVGCGSSVPTHLTALTSEGVFTSGSLAAGTSYTLCWHGPTLTSSSFPVRLTAAPVTVVTPPHPTLDFGTIVITKGDVTATITGEGLTTNVWVGIQCKRPILEIVPLPDGRSATIDISQLTDMQHDTDIAVCISAWNGEPDVAELRRTPLYVRFKSPPTFIENSLALTYAESLMAPRYEVVLAGSSLDQQIRVTLHAHPLCAGDASTPSYDLQSSTPDSGSFPLPVTQAGQPLSVCYSVKDGVWEPTNVTITTTPRPVFEGTTRHEISIAQHWEDPVITIPGMYLSTRNRPSMLWVVFGPCGDQAVAPLTGIQLVGNSPLSADVAISSSGEKQLCVAANPTEPSGSADWLDVVATGVTVVFADVPVFTVPAQVPWIGLGQRGVNITIRGTSLIPTTDLWIGISLDDTCGTATGSRAVPSEANDFLVLPSDSVLDLALSSGLQEAVAVAICWAASTTSPTSWNTSGLVHKVIPAAVITATATTHQVNELDVQSNTPPVITIHGKFLQTNMQLTMGCMEGRPSAAIICPTGDLPYCDEAIFTVPRSVTPGVHTVCHNGDPTAIKLEILERPVFNSANDIIVTYPLWEDGFQLPLTGTNIGGVWVAVVEQDSECSPLPETAARLPGTPNTSSSHITFAEMDTRLVLGKEYQICWRPSTPGLDVRQHPSKVHVLPLPSVTAEIFSPTLSEFWSSVSGTINITVHGTDLNQPLEGKLCLNSNCNNCGDDFDFLNGIAYVDRQYAEAFPGSTAVLCWKINIEAAFRESDVRVVLPRLAVFTPQDTPKRTYGTATNSLFLTGSYLDSQMYFGLSENGLACARGLNMVRAEVQDTTAVYYPKVVGLTANQQYLICFAYALQGSTYDTGLTLEWMGQPSFAPRTYSLTLGMIADGAAEIALTGSDLYPGIQAKISDNTCTSSVSQAVAIGQNGILNVNIALAGYKGGAYSLCWAVQGGSEWAAVSNVEVSLQKEPNFSAAHPITLSLTEVLTDSIVPLPSAHVVAPPIWLSVRDVNCDGDELGRYLLGASGLEMIGSSGLFAERGKRTGQWVLCWAPSMTSGVFATGVAFISPAPPVFPSISGTAQVSDVWDGTAWIAVTTEQLTQTLLWLSMEGDCSAFQDPLTTSFSGGALRAALPREVLTTYSVTRQYGLCWSIDLPMWRTNKTRINGWSTTVTGIPHVDSVEAVFKESLGYTEVNVSGTDLGSNGFVLQVQEGDCTGRARPSVSSALSSGKLSMQVPGVTRGGNISYVMCVVYNSVVSSETSFTVQPEQTSPVTAEPTAVPTQQPSNAPEPPACTEPAIYSVFRSTCFTSFSSCELASIQQCLQTFDDCQTKLAADFASCITPVDTSVASKAVKVKLAISVDDFTPSAVPACISGVVDVLPLKIQVLGVQPGSVTVNFSLLADNKTTADAKVAALSEYVLAGKTNNPFKVMGWDMVGFEVEKGDTAPQASPGDESDDGFAWMQFVVIPALAGLAACGLCVLVLVIRRYNMNKSQSPARSKGSINDMVEGSPARENPLPERIDEEMELSESSGSVSWEVETSTQISGKVLPPPVPPKRSSTASTTKGISRSSSGTSTIPATHKKPHYSRDSVSTTDIEMVVTAPTPTGKPHPIPALPIAQNACTHCGHPWNGGRFCAYCGKVVYADGVYFPTPAAAP